MCFGHDVSWVDVHGTTPSEGILQVQWRDDTPEA